jgi:GGDEF domain-containing protein
MRLLESHVFSHGYAYRHGGDEYAMLLPSLDYNLAKDFLDSLRRKIESLKYRGIDERITVSIGFCYVDPNSYLTDREAEERANRAMNFAKEPGGKNCVAGFLEERYDDKSLTVLTPKNGGAETQ